MTKDKLIEMAKQAGFEEHQAKFDTRFEPFAKLVAEKERAPQRTWVGLTRTELIKCGVLPFGMSYKLCQAIEDKLKEKNT